MNKMKKLTILLLLIAGYFQSFSQNLKWNNQEFEVVNATASVVQLDGKEVIKVERDLDALPFDRDNLIATVDEPTYIKLKGQNIENGVVEVKVMSKIQSNTPFTASQGFIGLAFRINEGNTAYESIYLRPRVGRSESQLARNHTVQYYAYPDYKFDKLRQEEYKGQYETYANIGLNEWITMRIEFSEKTAKLYLNDQKSPAFIVNEMLGNSNSGSIALWVDIGTEGYFKDLKVMPLQNPVDDIVKDWERAKAYTKEYLDGMPEEGYALKPTPEIRSFAEQMLHLTDANYGFVSAATGVENPIGRGESENSADKSKENVIKLVMAGYDFAIDNLKKLTPDQLSESIQLFGRFEMSRETALAKCFEHQTHHRGQTTVYLRLAGVKPPQEKLF